MVSSGHMFTEAGITFRKNFSEKFDYLPGAAAAYAYDGMKLILEVIQRNGAERDQIINALPAFDYKQGITGKIRFDDKGNNIGTFRLMTIINGNPRVVAGEN